MTDTDKSQMLFASLVLSLHSSAMFQMGKLKSPVTGKVERDLAGAQATIDVLDMLKLKTKGNLAGEEERLLTQVLSELKLNYVDEANKPEQPAGGSSDPTEPGQRSAGGSEAAPPTDQTERP